MPFNLLLLPFLGGYIFVSNWNRTRFHILRADKERLLIYSSIAGVIFIAAVYAVYIAASNCPYLSCSYLPSTCIEPWWQRNLPFEYSGISVISFLIGASLWWPLNYFLHPRKEEIDRIIEQDAEPFEEMLWRSQRQGRQVCITTDSRKVYVGRILHQSNPAKSTANIALLVFRSGYRASDTLEMVLPINYDLIHKKIRHQIATKIYSKMDVEADNDIEKKRVIVGLYQQAQLQLGERLQLVLPVREIVSINYFDKEIYDELHPPKEEKPSDPEPVVARETVREASRVAVAPGAGN